MHKTLAISHLSYHNLQVLLEYTSLKGFHTINIFKEFVFFFSLMHPWCYLNQICGNELLKQLESVLTTTKYETVQKRLPLIAAVGGSSFSYLLLRRTFVGLVGWWRWLFFDFCRLSPACTDFASEHHSQSVFQKHLIKIIFRWMQSVKVSNASLMLS